MADPIVWGELPKSQSDNTTIDQAIAAAIAAHEADPDAHYAAGAAIDIHRTSDVIDHPALSVVPDKITNDVIGIGQTAGVFPQQGQAWVVCTGVPAGQYNKIIYCGFATPVWVAIGQSGAHTTSSDGIAWTARSGLNSNNWDACAFGAGKLVVGGYGSNTNRFGYSTDGINFTFITIANLTQVNSLLWDGTQFVASITKVISGVTTQYIYTSADGVSWTDKAATMPDQLNELCYSAALNRYVVTANGNAIYSSTNLTSWTLRFLKTDWYVQAPVAGDSFFSANFIHDYIVGGDEVVDFYMGSSADGISWTPVPCSSDSYMLGGCYYLNTYVFVGQGGVSQSIQTSPDGRHYNLVTRPGSGNLTNVAPGPDRIVACDHAGGANSFVYSDITV